MSKRSWLPIILVIIFGIFLIAVAMVGAGAYYFFNHVGIETTSAESAAREFEEARKPFAAQHPLLSLEGRHVRVDADEKARMRAEGAPLENLHILAWDPDEDKLVRLTIPFWLLRLKSGGRIRLNSGTDIFDADDMNLTVEDLERHGPGLILDAAERNGQRVLIWTQ
jgi:hypothetical protein